MDTTVISAGPQPPQQPPQHQMNSMSGPPPSSMLHSNQNPNTMPLGMPGIVRSQGIPPQGMMFMHGLPGQMRPLLGMPQPPGHMPGYPPFGGGMNMPPRPPLLNPMGGHGPPPGLLPPGGMGQHLPPEPEDEPLSKKTKNAEDALIPEGQFFATNSSPSNFSVALPNVPDKPEMNLNGQLIPFTMDLGDSISLLKTKINEAIGLGPGKQKLSREGLFFKDQNTLAFYNIGDNAIVQLSLKERGGRKK